jgi:DNA-binding NtrC family response regulator
MFPEDEYFGLTILAEIKDKFPDMPVIMLTVKDDHQVNSACIRGGAFDYFVKARIDYTKFVNSITNALESYESKLSAKHRLAELVKSLIRDCARLDEDVVNEHKIFGTIVTANPTMVDNCNLAKDIAKRASAYPILILGESGTGKELVAKAIHIESDRNDKPFQVVNSAAIPEDLIESELFGHERGAFTGATQQKKGKFELANSGIIFLDEIGDLSLTAQAKLLRVLQEKKFERVGGLSTIELDVQVIAATNKNLIQEMKDKKFREDLYYRLRTPIELPPLRERREDIPLLVNHFVQQENNKTEKKISWVNKDVLEYLTYSYNWPGNVRELENTVARMINSARQKGKDVIILEDIPKGYRLEDDKVQSPSKAMGIESEIYKAASSEAKREAMLHCLAKAGHKLKKNSGIITEAARQCGIDRAVFQRNFKKEFGMTPLQYWKKHKEKLLICYGLS